MARILYQIEDQSYEGYFARPANASPVKPCIVLFPAWDGVNSVMEQMAEDYAARGLPAFVVDVYGKGIRGAIDGDNSHLMNPLLEDRQELGRRIDGAFRFIRGLEGVDASRLIAQGYCFGGLCALDAARSNTGGLIGSIAIHALFTPPQPASTEPISASVLILHGWEDPMARDDFVPVTRELTERRADWQAHAYGHAMHAFTFKGADLPERGIQYNAKADRRSAKAVQSFIEELTNIPNA